MSLTSLTPLTRFARMAALAMLAVATGSAAAHAASTRSSPIALTSDDRFVWVVNPDNDSVSVIEVANDLNVLVDEIPVGDEPRCVAITPDDATVYVTNMASGTVSVIDAATGVVERTIAVGGEPFGCALTPDGAKLYVANFSSDDVSVIQTRRNKKAKRIKGVGPKPRGIAVTEDGSKVYVTQFLAQPRDDGRPVDEREGVDDGREGRVSVISSAKDRLLGTVVLDPIADTGFNSRGATLSASGPILFDPVAGTPQVPTGAFPNLLQGITLRGSLAYLPNTCSSPNGPVRFNVNVQSCLSVFDVATDDDSGQALNMNRGIQFEAPGDRLFITNPIAVTFEQQGDEGWVVSAAANRIVRVELDAVGTPTINAPAAPVVLGASEVVRVEVGKNPQGIVINSTDTRAYVMNFISRDVSVVDLGADPPVKLVDVAAAALPAPGDETVVHLGHELFNTSIGPPGTGSDPDALNATPPAGRMSDFGWGSCYGCHPDGLTDSVTWMFGDGPRQSISMESTFAHPQPPGALNNANGAPLLPLSHQRALNWSAVRDEVQDFELNIRNVSGGQGMIRDGGAVANFDPPNTGRDADLDAIAAYIAFGIRAPISPERKSTKGGRKAFEKANCQACHGGVNWSRSRVDFTPPPAAGEIAAGQLARFLDPVGTLDPANFNEVKAGAVAGQLNGDTANGVLGFNSPSLLSVFAGAPYLHDGSCPTLDCVLENVAHRSAGTAGEDTLRSRGKRKQLVRFLRSIDADTPPVE